MAPKASSESYFRVAKGPLSEAGVDRLRMPSNGRVHLEILVWFASSALFVFVFVFFFFFFFFSFSPVHHQAQASW